MGLHLAAMAIGVWQLVTTNPRAPLPSIFSQPYFHDIVPHNRDELGHFSNSGLSLYFEFEFESRSPCLFPNPRRALLFPPDSASLSSRGNGDVSLVCRVRDLCAVLVQWVLSWWNCGVGGCGSGYGYACVPCTLSRPSLAERIRSQIMPTRHSSLLILHSAGNLRYQVLFLYHRQSLRISSHTYHTKLSLSSHYHTDY